MERFNRVLGVAVLTSRWVFRQPLWLFQAVIFTLGFLVLMFAWGGVEAVKNFALLLVVSGFWSLGINIVAQDYGWNRLMRIDQMFIASPVTIFEYFVGMLLGLTLYNLLFIVLSLLMLWYLGILYVFPLLVILGLIGLVLGSFLGLITVLKVKNPTNISAITNPLATLTTILPPVYYPSTLLPYPLNKIASFVPPAALMEIARAATGFPASLSILEAILVIIGWLVVTAIVLCKLITWGRE